MNKNIHKVLILKLVLAWCLLSIVIGTAVYFVEHRKINDLLAGIVQEDSKGLITDVVDYLSSYDTASLEILQKKTALHIAKGNYLIVGFYDKDKKRILELARTESKEVGTELNKHPLDSINTNTDAYKKIHIGRQMYLGVMLPLRANNGTVIGYFKGIYKVKPGIMADINNRILFSLAQIVITVFITTLVMYPIIIVLNKGLIKLSIDLSNANIGMLEILGNVIAKRDNETNDHNYRVTIYAVRFAEAIGLNKKDIQGLIKGAFLHDIGKMGISDSILFKPGKLTDEEFKIMKIHVKHGVDIIKDYAWLKDAVDVVRHHHEKYMGNGYSTGLKENDIPMTARIFAIVDVFDALTSKRPYKEPLSLDRSIQILNEGKGTHFDPFLLEKFIKIVRALYKEINEADEFYLNDTLHKLIKKYFNPEIAVKKKDLT